MNERHFYLFFLVFVAFGVVVLVRGTKNTAPLRAGIILFFVIVASITTGWLLGLKIGHLVFGIYVIGWKSYVTHSVYITETQRHAVYLSNGRVIRGGQADIYEDVGLTSFFILAFIIGSLLIKLISRISPSTGAAIMRLLTESNQRR